MFWARVPSARKPFGTHRRMIDNCQKASWRAAMPMSYDAHCKALESCDALGRTDGKSQNWAIGRRQHGGRAAPRSARRKDTTPETNPRQRFARQAFGSARTELW